MAGSSARLAVHDFGNILVSRHFGSANSTKTGYAMKVNGQASSRVLKLDGKQGIKH
jgi:hypothetical protein